MAEQRTFNLSPATNSASLISSFLADRRARGLSPETLQSYETYLTPFAAWCTCPLEATPAVLASFLQSRTCGPGGKAAYYRAIRAFYRFLEEQDIIPADPTRRMKAPKVPKPIRYAVPVDALDTLLQGCEGARDRAIVSLLADTGLRRAELASIAVGDIQWRTDTIAVWGKGAKQRVVRYGPRSAELLRSYVGEVRPTESLFGLTKDGVSEMLERLQRRTGIKCNPHAFRRTFAVQSVRNGLNLFYVQSLLGHSSLTMTRIYAEAVNSEDAIRAYKPIVGFQRAAPSSASL